MRIPLSKLLQVAAPILLASTAFSQRFGPGQYVTSYINKPLAMFPCDLDGDVDVLASEYWSSYGSWYENNGDGTFKAKKTIASKVGQSTSIFATNLDRHGDADVLWTS